MPKFYYSARDRKGTITSGSIEAENPWLARKALNKLNLIVLDLSRFNLRLAIASLNDTVKKFTQQVTLEEQMVLLSQLETGVSVGIPILQMLNMLQQDLENEYLKATLAQIVEDVTDGSPLHVAFGKHTHIFDPIVVGLIKTGEVSGKLEETLGRITQMIEQKTENQAKVKSAIFYPKIVLFVLFMAFCLMVYVIIPKLKTFLATFGADLPPITKFVLGLSTFFTTYWYALVAAFIAGRYSFKKMVSTSKGKLYFDRLVLRVPVFGKIFVFLELNNFCVILDLLIDSGVPLMDALEILKESQRNEVFKDALTRCQVEISNGGSLTKGLVQSPVFPATFRNLLSIGEETGRMQPVLRRLGKYYQVQIDYQLDNLSKLIEPILLFFIFGMVLVLALAILLPIWQMSSSMNKSKF